MPQKREAVGVDPPRFLSRFEKYSSEIYFERAEFS